MRACMVVFVAMLACGYPPLPSVNLDAAPAVCFGKIVPICFPASAVPVAPRTLGTVEIDTDLTGSGLLCDRNNDQKARYCVVAGAGLTLPANTTLTAHGDKPLVLLSTTAMELLGSIDVSSRQTGAQLRGAGANPTDPGACAFATAPTAATMGGGGYGGSLGTPGGDGGDSQAGPGGGKAGSLLDTFPAVLRGGCKGGDGAVALPSLAAGGDGGGAVALIAAMQIHVDAMINASGGGGEGGAMGANNGGGGGGAGGMIVFDSTQPLMLGPNAKLWANGGSGGQGGSNTAGGGAGGESSSPDSPATSTSVANAGGNGADGAVGGSLGARGANATSGGGGGGGGGDGFIHASGLTGLTSISPPSSDPADPG